MSNLTKREKVAMKIAEVQGKEFNNEELLKFAVEVVDFANICKFNGEELETPEDKLNSFRRYVRRNTVKVIGYNDYLSDEEVENLEDDDWYLCDLEEDEEGVYRFVEEDRIVTLTMKN